MSVTTNKNRVLKCGIFDKLLLNYILFHDKLKIIHKILLVVNMHIELVNSPLNFIIQ